MLRSDLESLSSGRPLCHCAAPFRHVLRYAPYLRCSFLAANPAERLSRSLLKRICLGLGLLIVGFVTMQVVLAGRVLNDALVTHPFSHHIWQEVLMQNVGPNGAVDFGHVLVYPRRLNQYLDQLEHASPDNDPQAFPTHEDQTAYWINAHNAIAMRLIINHYPITSLRQVTDFETNNLYKLGGVPYTLSQIREKALHFDRSPAIVMTMTNYSAEAPPISTRAYDGKMLKSMSQQSHKKRLSYPGLIRFQHSRAGCVSVQISPFLKNFEAPLFKTPVLEASEDEDVFSETSDEPDAHKMEPAKGWAEWLRPFTAGTLYRELGQPCSKQVELLPGNPTLRQIQILRS